MKKLSIRIDSDHCGSVKIVPEDVDDIWNLYQLIYKGDRVKASTFRRIRAEASIKNESERIRITLWLQVESVDIDLTVGLLGVKGRVCSENEHVKVGAYHTLSIGVHDAVEVHKSPWDSITLKRMNDCLRQSEKSDIAAVVLQMGTKRQFLLHLPLLGIAHICSIKNSTVVLKEKIERAIPKKNPFGSSREKAIDNFFEKIKDGLLRHFDMNDIKSCILASPGFFRDNLYEYMIANSPDSPIAENKGKFVKVHTSHGFLSALEEIIKDPLLNNLLSDCAFKEEQAFLDKFMDTMRTRPDSAYYSYKHVQRASELNAIKVLLISSSLLRTSVATERASYLNLISSVREKAGTVKIFSSTHGSMERLDGLSGVAAILKYDIPEDDVDNEA